MGIKISLSIELEEFSTTASLGEKYKCSITAIANGVKKEYVFADPISALNEARHITFDWTQTFIKIKRDTKMKLQKQAKMKSKLIIP